MAPATPTPETPAEEAPSDSSSLLFVVAGVGGLLALAVVGSDTRGTLLVAAVVVAVVGGLFVMVVWQLDVGVTLYHDGRLRRTGWNGVKEVDVRSYQRVTIKERRHSDGAMLDFGDAGD